jgi:PAS domain S-box-containing protein
VTGKELKQDAKRMQTERALHKSQKPYRSLAENLADGVAILQDGRFLFVNEALASMFGYTIDNLVALETIELFRDDYKKWFDKLVHTFEKSAPPESFQAPCVHSEGREVWIEGHHCHIDWEGRPAILVTTRDITERKLRELATEQKVEHLERENIKLKETIKDRYKLGSIVGKSLDSTAPEKSDAGNTEGVVWEQEGLVLRDAVKAFEKELVSKALENNRWHRAKTASMLGIPERTLYRKLKQLRLS